MAKNTDKYILDVVSPIFNKKGYVSTSMSDLTEATGLTKGAIYGNFKNKEELAVRAFKENAKRAIGPLGERLQTTNDPVEKLRVITDYYRDYFERTLAYGGCPVLNVGIDAKHNNAVLYETAKLVSIRLIEDLRIIIQTGIESGKIAPDVDAETLSRKIYSCIEGGIYMSTLHNDSSYLLDVLDLLDAEIQRLLI